MSKVLSIGAVAKAAGVKAPTIRYYESASLMPVAVRSERNRRFYGEEAVRRLRFIRQSSRLSASRK